MTTSYRPPFWFRVLYPFLIAQAEFSRWLQRRREGR